VSSIVDRPHCVCHNLSAAPHAARKTRSVPWRYSSAAFRVSAPTMYFPMRRRKFHKLEPNAILARASKTGERNPRVVCTRRPQNSWLVCMRTGYQETSRSARCPLLRFRVVRSSLRAPGLIGNPPIATCASANTMPKRTSPLLLPNSSRT